MSQLFKVLKPRKALNKAFLKVKPTRTEIECFKTNLIQLLDRINDTESEEFHKNLVIDFLKKTYYDPNYFVNTKGRNDLVIHNGNNANSPVGVIIEAKKPTNKSEMIKPFAVGDSPQQMIAKLNTKAFQELVLYYLRERITHKNLEVKYLIATNINEWFIFDAALFDRLFAQNKTLVKQFLDFEGGRLADTKTDFFYKQIAEPFIAGITTEIEFTYFNIQDYQKPLLNTDKADDNKLIALFKLLSAAHLLKLPFTNDSNSLDKKFYSELLHIIGLTETKEGGKKLIERKKEVERDLGSILENAIIQLDSLDKINRLDKPSQYGNTQEERLFNVGLELTITWINRILFLKLLEAQLTTYHKGNTAYAFLSLQKIKDFDELNALFFQVLARKYADRNQDVKTIFEKVPYLNSSLFEPTEIEQVTLFISNLKDDRAIPIIGTTVLKNEQGKKRTGSLSTLEYLFEFLNAYDFASEGTEDIQEDNKTLINASVLGLIFEKINGYKDGSFFTPGFITMYMCRETIRKAFIQKMNERIIASGHHNWQHMTTLEEVYNQIGDRVSKSSVNEVINQIKICDPAVGSGHFLVSALNELIALKSDMRVLMDKDGKLLRDYHVEVVNDELIVTDEEGSFFEYNPTNKESQRIQETLFHEKQTIIENCLFGVDINPNSVKICRLRLWIELLKNAYYKNATELETLPNIDINIKCGNSLVSRFAIDADLKPALKKSKVTIEGYRKAVDTYRNAESKEQKKEMEKLILAIKQSFSSEIRLNDPIKKRLDKLASELYHKFTGTFLFEPEAHYGKNEKKLEKTRQQERSKLENEIEQLNKKIEEIKGNKIYENAFEWRFEFPEALNNDGDFVGFDIVIGNPPYVQLQSIKEASNQLEKMGYLTYTSMGDLYALFYEKGNHLLKENGLLCFISGSAWMRTNYGQNLRNYFNKQTTLLSVIDLSDCDIFDSATVLTSIISFTKSKNKQPIKAIRFTKKDQGKLAFLEEVFNNEHIVIENFPDTSWVITDNQKQIIKGKVERVGTKLLEWDIVINYGIKTGFNEAFIIDGKIKNELIAKDPKSIEIIEPLLRGRDVKRYYYDFDDLWLIGTFPSLNISIENYPAIKNYLESFGRRLEQSGEKDSRKKTSGKWFETQDSIAYWEDFKKPKIIYPNMTKFLPFSLDLDGKYLNDKCFILTGENIYYLTAFLNSKLFKFCFADSFPELQGNSKEVKKFIVEQIPVKKVADETLFKNHVTQILDAKKQNSQADTSNLENQIDQLVYQLYELTEEEIKIIECS